MFAFRILSALVIWVVLAAAPAAAQAPGCTAPAPVCAASSRVFAISSFDPVGSALWVAPGLLVTARHVIADNKRAEVFLPDGSKKMADVVPTAYPGDLVLLEVAVPDQPSPLPVAEAKAGQQVFAIGADVGRGAIRVYDPGKVVAVPPAGKPLARVHHTARSQPGNSGGALVTADGRLVAIVSSGGEGRNEAIPAAEIAKLRTQSGPAHQAQSERLGLAYRRCAEGLDAARASRREMTEKQIDFLDRECRATGNRQLLDLAGQAFGRRRMFDRALALFNAALDQDPNARNTRISLAITLHVAQRYKEEMPHLKILMDELPDDAQVLRLAIQAGKWGGDDALAQRGFDLLVKYHPRLKPVAERFMKAPPPPRRSKPEPR